jgi:hypothetical protein
LVTLDSPLNLVRSDLSRRCQAVTKPSGKGLPAVGLFFVVGVGDAMKKQDVLRSGHKHRYARNFGHVSDTTIPESEKVSRR